MPMSIRCLLVLLVALPACGVANAQIHRCTTGGGDTIYTDRSCRDLGAVERLPDVSAGTRAPYYRDTCPRSLRDLVYRLTSAIDERDVNRLASVYYWRGQSTRSGYALMQRLDAIAQRPLADIVPVYPQPPPAPPVPASQAGQPDANTTRAADPVHVADPQASADPGPDPDPDTGVRSADDAYPQATVHRTPIGLRLEQTLAHSATPSRTVFGLHRAFGCWWLRL